MTNCHGLNVVFIVCTLVTQYLFLHFSKVESLIVTIISLGQWPNEWAIMIFLERQLARECNKVLYGCSCCIEGVLWFIFFWPCRNKLRMPFLYVGHLTLYKIKTKYLFFIVVIQTIVAEREKDANNFFSLLFYP